MTMKLDIEAYISMLIDVCNQEVLLTVAVKRLRQNPEELPCNESVKLYEVL
jgi:hypothetical protein